MVIFDGPPHTNGAPTLAFGARGIADVTLTAYGPRVPQHSGQWGNYVPNPALRLAQVLASMKDAEGRVTIPGFYDGVVIDEKTRRVLEAVPKDLAALHRSLGIARADGVAPSPQEAIQYPSLNIRGLRSAWVGEEARTIIPADAVAELDVRLVYESDPDRLLSLVRRHIEAQGYHVVSGRDPTDDERGGPPALDAFRLERLLPCIPHRDRFGAGPMARRCARAHDGRAARDHPHHGRLGADLAVRRGAGRSRRAGRHGQPGQQPALAERESARVRLPARHPHDGGDPVGAAGRSAVTPTRT
jgi:hypothetical protein